VRWLTRLINLLDTPQSIYKRRGLLILNEADQASENWIDVPDAQPSGTLAGPLPRMASRARTGSLMAALLRLQDAHQEEQDEDWLTHIKPVWKER